ncbi:MAG TPA: hypothetical protein VFQ53_00725 [Kofleriaceae bacterium]|nr:hypothetical protein [Kofleriaceae bacterium]
MANRPWLGAMFVLAACSEHGSSPPPDAANDISMCFPVSATAVCFQGQAITRVRFSGGSTSNTLCRASEVTLSATCAAGCTIEGAFALDAAHGPLAELVAFAGHPEVLCAETSEPPPGAACRRPLFPATSTNVRGALAAAVPCVPTRAEVAGDGTVVRRDLTCSDTGQCVAASPPVVSSYLAPCPSAIVTANGRPDVNGVVAVDPTIAFDLAACLLAWDAATQTVRSGTTLRCVGDWQCPSDAICDDALTPLGDTPAPVAVCKPGPRGVLTPAMLAP